MICNIKNCSAVGLYRVRKYTFCEKHRDWAQKITKADWTRRAVRYEASRDEAMSRLASENHRQGTEGKKVRQRSF